jgi:DnaK suppressor protein
MKVRALDMDSYKEALFSKAAECDEKLKELTAEISVETSPDLVEHSLRAAEREMAVSRLESSHRLLRQIESALSRMARGKYGLCLKCEEDIDTRRLDALPWAIFCVQCQESVDQLREAAHNRRVEHRQAA